MDKGQDEGSKVIILSFIMNTFISYSMLLKVLLNSASGFVLHVNPKLINTALSFCDKPWNVELQALKQSEL